MEMGNVVESIRNMVQRDRTDTTNSQGNNGIEEYDQDEANILAESTNRSNKQGRPLEGDKWDINQGQEAIEHDFNRGCNEQAALAEGFDEREIAASYMNSSGHGWIEGQNVQSHEATGPSSYPSHLPPQYYHERDQHYPAAFDYDFHQLLGYRPAMQNCDYDQAVPQPIYGMDYINPAAVMTASITGMSTSTTNQEGDEEEDVFYRSLFPQQGNMFPLIPPGIMSGAPYQRQATGPYAIYPPGVTSFNGYGVGKEPEGDRVMRFVQCLRDGILAVWGDENSHEFPEQFNQESSAYCYTNLNDTSVVVANKMINNALIQPSIVSLRADNALVQNSLEPKNNNKPEESTLSRITKSLSMQVRKLRKDVTLPSFSVFKERQGKRRQAAKEDSHLEEEGDKTMASPIATDTTTKEEKAGNPESDETITVVHNPANLLAEPHNDIAECDSIEEQNPDDKRA